MSRHDATIFALSSGRPPAAIAVIRISGPRAGAALEALGVKVPPPRQAKLARIKHPASGEIIDEALALWFPGPDKSFSKLFEWVTTGSLWAPLGQTVWRMFAGWLLAAMAEVTTPNLFMTRT